MNSISFPPFYVMDGSWGPIKLSVSESAGLSILLKKTEKTVETWSWHETSHATIKSIPKRIVQVKKFCGVTKILKFASYEDMNRFELTLKNAHPVKGTTNWRFQRKLIFLKADGIELDQPSPTFLQANHQLAPSVWNGQSAPLAHHRKALAESDNLKVASSSIPPPPPPPPMPLKPELVNRKAQAIKPDSQVITHGSVLQEMQSKFAGGMIKASLIKAMVQQQVGRPKPCYLQPQKGQTEQTEAVVEDVHQEQIPEPIPAKTILEPTLKPVAEPVQPLANDANNKEVDDIPPEHSNWPTNRAERNFPIWTAESNESPFMSQVFRAAVRRDLHFTMKDKLAQHLEFYEN